MAMIIKKENFMEAEALRLENTRLRAVVLPRHGGKIASVYYKQTGFELLFQNPRGAFASARFGASFADFDASGFDDCFPTIDAERVTVEGETLEYPDHGEIWSAGFEYEMGDPLCLRYQSEAMGYLYQKEIWLRGKTLHIRYTIHNLTGRPLPALWAAHCLVRYEPDMRLVFPRGADRLVNVLDSPRLGPRGSIYHLPKDDTPVGRVDFTMPPPPGEAICEKVYLMGRAAQGRCGYLYPTQNTMAILQYDQNVLPYLGFWVTAGGFRGDYNCALEPASGFYDNVATAAQNGSLLPLGAGQELSFQLSITLGTLPPRFADKAQGKPEKEEHAIWQR